MTLINYFIFLTFLIGMFLSTSRSQEFKYQIDRNSDEWKSLTVVERKKMLQIPEDMLKSIPTEQLIQAYIENRFCSLMFAYNSLTDGFDRVYNEFNGLRELMNRKDAALKLIDYYKNMKVDGYDSGWEPSKRGRYTFRFMYIENLLSQPEIISQLNENDTKNLIDELLKKVGKKLEHISEYSIIGLSYNAYAIAHILKNNNLLKYEMNIDHIDTFLETGRIVKNNTIYHILEQARAYINN